MIAYLLALLLPPLAVAGQTVAGYGDSIARCGSAEALAGVLARAEERLYTPGADGYDERAFVAVLTRALASPLMDAEHSMRPRMLLEQADRNRPGTVAADFAAVTLAGDTLRLSDVTAPYTLLFFNDPTCDDCLSVKQQLAQSIVLKALADEGRLAVVAVYPYDDEAAWRRGSYPSWLINCWDSKQAIDTDGLYVLRRMPTLYLLGPGRTVMLKDTAVEAVERALAAPERPE